MRARVKCVNCKIIWDRVSIGLGADVELTEDICLVCPSCGSNAYERLPEKEIAKEGVSGIKADPDLIFYINTG